MSDADSEFADMCDLLLVATDGPPGTRYTKGHLYAQSILVGGFYPAIAVWGHTLTSTHAPRLIDQRTAKKLVYLARDEYDNIGNTATERHPGTLADWRVVKRDGGDGEVRD